MATLSKGGEFGIRRRASLNNWAIMEDGETQPQSEAAAATSRLDRGLKSCRTLIYGYRSLLLQSDEPAAEPPVQESETPPQS